MGKKFGSFSGVHVVLGGNVSSLEMGTIETDSLDSHVFMELAIEEANLAFQRLEVPVGCVIVENRKVIASRINRTNETRNATRHAEMEAIDGLLQQWQRDGLLPPDVVKRLLERILYVTCEPCIMCAATLSFLGLKEVFYRCTNDKFGGCGSILSLHSTSSKHCSISRSKGFKCTRGIIASEAVFLFQTFYERGNPNTPKPHRAASLNYKNKNTTVTAILGAVSNIKIPQIHFKCLQDKYPCYSIKIDHMKIVINMSIEQFESLQEACKYYTDRDSRETESYSVGRRRKSRRLRRGDRSRNVSRGSRFAGENSRRRRRRSRRRTPEKVRMSGEAARDVAVACAGEWRD
ncbi:hypothetical protein Cgig2_025470 [Carnegiea gigantea]|uniref:CMP/dCMP-type deaminase domain-containing protein n=1 Tax=Carnegiea gigantea TaxID=171969 RepID=A0A9Q1K716_9CARY|nr:hypothetical protein Cgig2_025470 [Carnegiea gigantea]